MVTELLGTTMMKLMLIVENDDGRDASGGDVVSSTKKLRYNGR